MRADVSQPQRMRVLDQQPEHAVAARKVADRRALGRRDAAGQKALQALAPLVHDPHRGVLRAGQLARDLEHPRQQARRGPARRAAPDRRR